jgi:hypothetical protein
MRSASQLWCRRVQTGRETNGVTDGTTNPAGKGAGSSLLLALVVGVGLVVTALAHGADSLTTEIVLDHGHVRVGGVIRGKLLLDNTTSTRKVLLRGCVTNGRFEIGLEAPNRYPQGGVFSLVGCNPLQVLVAANPGVTVYRFRLRATYTECAESAKGEPGMPLCLKGPDGKPDIFPTLPAGDYTAVFFPDGKWLGPKVAPAALAVTRAR